MSGISIILGQGIVMNWYYKHNIGLEIERFWKEVGIVFIIPIILTLISLLLSIVLDYYSVLTLLFAIILYTLVYCCLMWFLIMNDIEKEFIKSTIFRRV